jgi:TolA-binding protein
LGHPTNAVATLQSLIQDYKTNKAVRSNLFPHAHYQLLRASLELGELASATVSMQTILRDYPESTFRDPGILLVGQSVSQKGDRGLARSIYQEFMKRFPESSLLAEVGLAWARSYVEDKDWKSAMEQYQTWIDRFPTNSLRPRADFNLAWANAQAGQETNALRLFTNFVARFPTNELSARARYWIGDYFFNHKQFVEAQIHYQKLAETFPGTPMAYQARMMAGRAAFASRLFWKDAAGPGGHFKTLINDEQCPADVRAEAYFALGDALVQGEATGNDNRQRFEEAIVAFSRIPALYPTNRLVPLAWGRVGDCYLQLAVQDSNLYPQVTNAYWNVLQSPRTSRSARCQAELGIGRVLEKLAELHPVSERRALLTAARDHYLNVVYGNTNDTEQTDALWLKEAGLAAARLAESEQQWEIASNLYARLVDLLPPLRPTLERRLQHAQEQLRQGRN